MHTARALANGLNTDHPVPGIPFADDGHLPLEDSRALKTLARHGGAWDAQDDGQWWCFLPDPGRPESAWCIRHHPRHGHTVLLYPAKDAPAVHREWWGEPLLFRAGGYWWDGTDWYRPGQVWDPAHAAYQRRPVPQAVTVTAADYLALADGADPARGRLYPVTGLDAAPSDRGWPDDLARWAAHRGGSPGRPPSECVITLHAPELEAEQLLGVPAVARMAGIAASTLRSYICRGDVAVPSPQSVVSGRSLWARPVAEEWTQQRRTPADDGALVPAGTDGLSPGAADTQYRFARMFFALLWGRPERRKRWTPRHRTEAEVRQVAEELGRTVATRLDDIVPADALAATVTHALLDTLTADSHAHGRPATVEPALAEMLRWLSRHHPEHARQAIDDAAEGAERRRSIPHALTEKSLRLLLSDQRAGAPDPDGRRPIPAAARRP